MAWDWELSDAASFVHSLIAIPPSLGFLGIIALVVSSKMTLWFLNLRPSPSSSSSKNTFMGNFCKASQDFTPSVASCLPAHDAATTEIKINPNSAIASDGIKIFHNVSLSSVCLHLRKTQRCKSPSFIGRLSGKSLGMLEWTKQSTNTTYIFCGSYKNLWLDVGSEYFLEIIITFCNDFGIGQQSTCPEIPKMLGFDFSHICMENPRHHRVTARGASIFIPDCKFSSRTTFDGVGDHHFGRWVSINDSIVSPLYTRFQPQGCRHIIDIHSSRCAIPINLTRHQLYSFQWQNDTEVRLKQHIKPFQLQYVMKMSDDVYKDQVAAGEHSEHKDTIVDLDLSHRKRAQVEQLEAMAHGGTGLEVDRGKRNLTFDGEKVCVVGWSHSYTLVHAFWKLGLGHRFIWANIENPSEANYTFFYNYYHERNCTKFIIGLGQHPAGWVGYRPWLFGEYLNAIEKIVYDDSIFKLGNRDIRLYMRSIHHIPIGERTGGCIPTDWRSPTVIDGYNYLTESIVDARNDYRVQFLSSNFITYPLWDSARDWGHLPLQVQMNEALYIAATVLYGRD